MMGKDLYTLLLRSFDGQLTPKESKLLEEGLRSDANLRREKEKIEKIRVMIGERDDDFDPFFETRVMSRIEAPRENWVSGLFNDHLSFAFKRVAILSAGILLALVISAWVREGALSLSVLTGISELTTDEASTFMLYGTN